MLRTSQAKDLSPVQRRRDLSRKTTFCVTCYERNDGKRAVSQGRRWKIGRLAGLAFDFLRMDSGRAVHRRMCSVIVARAGLGSRTHYYISHAMSLGRCHDYGLSGEFRAETSIVLNCSCELS